MLTGAKGETLASKIRVVTFKQEKSTSAQVPGTPKVRARRADYERNLERIVEAATAVLGEKPSASMSEIAAASGLVRATLYRHFPTREDLLVAILRRAFEQTAEAIATAEPEQGPAPEALGRVVDALAVVSDRYRVISTGIGIVDLIDAPLMEMAVNAFEPVHRLVERGQREGTLRDDLPSQWLVAATVALVSESAKAADRGELKAVDAGSIVRRTLLEPLVSHKRGTS